MWHPQNPLQSSISSRFISSLFREVDDDAVQVSANVRTAKVKQLLYYWKSCNYSTYTLLYF